MTDIIEVIESHHREIEDLFATFESTHDAAVAIQLCDELDRHATAEEQVIYPVIMAEVPGGREMAGNGEHDHRVARQLAHRIRETSDPGRLAELVGELKLTVEHHVDEEESEVLPLTRAALEPERLTQLGSDFAAAEGPRAVRRRAGAPARR